MSGWDWLIVAASMCGFVATGIVVRRNQRQKDLFFIAGRRLGWWNAAASNLATHASLGLLSVPAFVALREGGGLSWLQTELALPLATVAIMALLAPFFRELELTTVYEYLERRFGPEVHLFAAGVFLLSRGLITGVTLYVAAMVLAVSIGAPIWTMLFLVGAVATTYSVLGGLRAVVITDLVQLTLLIAAAMVCTAVAIDHVGGWSQAFATFPPERLQVLQLGGDPDAPQAIPFWGAVVGGFFFVVLLPRV